MKTLCIVICHCIGWQPVINAIPCICCGILALVMLYFLLRFVVAPLIANRNERKIKELNHEYEKKIKESETKEQDERLNRRIREFESIELTKLILGKLNSGDDINKIRTDYESLKTSFDELKNKLATSVTVNVEQNNGQ